jgi:hypothetical protein
MHTDPIDAIAERWQSLERAAAALHERTASLAADQVARVAAESARHTTALSEIRAQHDTVVQQAAAMRDAVMFEAQATFDAGRAKLDTKAQQTHEEIDQRAEKREAEAKEAYEHALWLADSVFEASENAPRIACAEMRQQVAERLAAMEAIVAEAKAQTARFRQRVPSASQSEPAKGFSATIAYATEVACAADAQQRLRRLKIPGLFRGPILLVPAILLGIAAAAGGWVAGLRGPGLGVAAGAGVVLTAIGAVALWFVARKQVARAWQPLHRSSANLLAAADIMIKSAEAEREQKERAAKQQLARERDAVHARWRPVLQHIREQRASRREELEGKLPDRRAVLDGTLRESIEEATRRFDSIAKEQGRVRDAAVATEMQRHAAAESDAHAEHTDARASLHARWIAERDGFIGWARSLTDEARAWQPDLERVNPAPMTFDPALCVGAIHLSAERLQHGCPTDPALAWPTDPSWKLPLLRPLPDNPSLLIDAPAEAREQGLAALQAAAVRLLVQAPPGKVRLTLIDPVGLGQNFAGFMHLADEMEQLAGERIWTEPRHIEQKLTDLTEHMETVIQKYLRNEYATIADYNAQAGQLAEPLRIVVMADFPAGLNDNATRRLASILQSGARCGVHLLLLRDTTRPMPSGVAEADVLRACTRILWRDGAFHLDRAGLENEPVTLDAPPSANRLQELLRTVGRAAKQASVVQVPFSTIAPADDAVWTASTAAKVEVPIGRTGATQLQRMLLGEGTKQHVLLAGKTGSGKSTLLNAMIVNMASWFSPDELELWLIDFKKGVEFKVYASAGLPHARAVAVESDREFGLSVLQGLDAELKRRGDLFRAAGVQDLAAWRRLGRPEKMPRALLIVDEFQELFVEEDKVSQEAALLLDRLVRQGRAFGMHVILGSQTLGGAYALPRTTMGQMGVRIALQCNEADAALILSDDNTAARLLSRPGEAIYNDAGGMIEGNSPFQVVWLGDHEREQRVRQLAQRGAPSAGTRPAPIVFDGTSKASMAACRPLRERMRAAGVATSLPVHLGEPVAIREATVALLRRQSGANLLIVGQDDRMAIGMSLAALVSVRAACGASAQVTILDGSPADTPEAGLLAAAAAQLGMKPQMPGYRDVDDAIRGLGQVVAGRIESGRTDEPACVLLVHGIQRFRSLRRDEDDFSFSSSDGPPKPDRIFASILRDGPAVGVHVVLWSDTAASLQRSVDRGSMREFDLRALLQMGANDSSALIDSPAASRLGAERALLFSEERGTVERFRPFEPPSAGELTELLGT